MRSRVGAPAGRRRALLLSWVVGLWGLASLLHAGGGPENLILVVNADSWASKTIANEYIRLRQIPASHVIYLTGFGDHENLGVDDFREKILKPVLKTIEARRLAPQIDYLIYSADFPHRIDVRADRKKLELPRAMNGGASINSLTYLYQSVLAKRAKRYLSLDSNWYVRQAKAKREDTEWRDEEKKQLLQVEKLFYERAKRAKARMEAFKKRLKAEGKTYKKGMRPPASEADKAFADGLWAKVVGILTALRKTHPNSRNVQYNLACGLAMTGKPEAAMAALRAAFEAGWWSYGHTGSDPDLVSLRERDDFKALLAQMRRPEFTVPKARAFRGLYNWSRAGDVVPPGKGPRYLLSMMLGVTSGRGNSVEEVLAYLRRSVAADGTQPQGTVYILKNQNVRSTTREWAFHQTVKTLKEMGIKAVVEDGVLPEGKEDVAGAVVGSASFDWGKSKSVIVPGAICEHLTSCGGMMGERAGQTPCTEFLRYGAAGSSGTVNEPYAIQAKFPMPLMHIFYAQGSSLAEAFYESVAGPFQLLILGEPLCQPWARRPGIKLAAWSAARPAAGTVTVKPVVAAAAGRGVARIELFLDGFRFHVMKPGESYGLDTMRMPDGYHELRAVAISADAVETQGCALAPLVVDNHHHRLTISGPGQTVAYDENVTIRVAAKGAKTIQVLHNSRAVGLVQGASGTVTVPASVLGQGPVSLQGIAVFDEAAKSAVISAPLSFTVMPAAARALAAAPDAATLKPWMLMTVGEKAYVLPHLKVSVPGLVKGAHPKLDTYFEVSQEAVYQFQVRVRAGAITTLLVDDKPLPTPGVDRWFFVPVTLKPGWHRLTVAGVANGKMQLAMRFGGPGARSLNGKAFKHVPVDGEVRIQEPQAKKKANPRKKPKKTNKKTKTGKK